MLVSMLPLGDFEASTIREVRRQRTSLYAMPTLHSGSIGTDGLTFTSLQPNHPLQTNGLFPESTCTRLKDQCWNSETWCLIASLALIAPMSMWAKLAVNLLWAWRNINLPSSDGARNHFCSLMTSQTVKRLIEPSPQWLEMAQRRGHWSLMRPGAQHRPVVNNGGQSIELQSLVGVLEA